ncbi:MAG: helix-turn-helix domain-containing protein [Amylibacter sp.]|nr:helix-turn-helix domain-containing protein [Amylibacter sp.]
MTTEQLAFRALADPTRREILRLLNRRDMTIGEITDLFPITRGAVKKHLEFLVHGGLVSVKKKAVNASIDWSETRLRL